jgi:hypothetical protein
MSQLPERSSGHPARRVAYAACGLGAIAGLVVVTILLTRHWSASERRSDARALIEAVEATEIHSTLTLTNRVLATVVKHPESFSKEDADYFLRVAVSNANDVETKVVPYIVKDEALERQRHPDRTEKDEQDRIAMVRAQVERVRKYQDMLAKR